MGVLDTAPLVVATLAFICFVASPYLPWYTESSEGSDVVFDFFFDQLCVRQSNSSLRAECLDLTYALNGQDLEETANAGLQAHFGLMVAGIVFTGLGLFAGCYSRKAQGRSYGKVLFLLFMLFGGTFMAASFPLFLDLLSGFELEEPPSNSTLVPIPQPQFEVRPVYNTNFTATQVVCGEVINGSTVGAPRILSNRSSDVVYSIELSFEPSNLTVNVRALNQSSNFSVGVEWFLDANLTQRIANASGGNFSQISRGNLPPQAYYVVVTGVEDGDRLTEGDFEMTTTCSAGPLHFTCKPHSSTSW